MFGYVRPNIPELRVREKLRYDAWYCGLCCRLGRDYGLAARAALSYDCAFLALTLGSLENEPAEAELKRCPFKPLGRKKPVIISDTSAMDFAAACCILLARYKLDDDIADGRRLSALGKPPLHHAYKKAKRNYPAADAAIRRGLSRLAEIEAARIPNPDSPANAFGELLAELLIIFPVPDGEKPVLRELGRSVGRFIYLLDAWDDRASDEKKGLYNPFLLSGADRVMAEFLINISINNAISAYNLLEVKHDSEITANIITEGLFAAMDSVMSGKDEKRKDAPTK